jgi:pimeloyl-ACP methyl ester carboxylesterase
MAKFTRETRTIDGVEVVLHTAGKGEPVVFFHGAGTVDGFDFTAPWTDRFRVIVPYHPGFGDSGDDPSFTEPHDYVLHYLELFDALGLDRFSLVGLSFGGDLAARFAIEHGHRLKTLVLIAPATMLDPRHPPLDILVVPGEELVSKLVSDFDALRPRLPEKPDLDFLGARYRESATFARLFWERPHDPRVARYAHRIRTPTLLVWGDRDQIVPVEQAAAWKDALPQAELRVFKGAGHLVHLEEPAAVAAIGGFLESHS